MKALRALSVYIGSPRLFSSFKTSLGLKWKKGEPVSTIRSILEDCASPEGLLEWAGRVRSLGWKYYLPVALAFLTGLRAGEAFTVLRIVRERGIEGYYNAEIRALEHFRFPCFLRGTKNAYISFVSDRLLGELEGG